MPDQPTNDAPQAGCGGSGCVMLQILQERQESIRRELVDYRQRVQEDLAEHRTRIREDARVYRESVAKELVEAKEHFEKITDGLSAKFDGLMVKFDQSKTLAMTTMISVILLLLGVIIGVSIEIAKKGGLW